MTATTTTEQTEHRVEIERVNEHEYRGFDVSCSCGWSVLRGTQDSALDAAQDHANGHEVK